MRVLLLLIYLFISTSANSQNFHSFKGQILSQQDSVPIFNAHIYFDNTHIGTTTNENGKFAFHFPIEFKLNDIKISCIGYKPVTISERQNHSITIFLEKDQLLLDEVTIATVNPTKILIKAIESMDNNYYNNGITKTLYYRESFKRNGKPLRNLEVVADLVSEGFSDNHQSPNKYDISISQKRPGFNYDSSFRGGNGIGVLHSLSWTEKYLKIRKLKDFNIGYEGKSTFRGMDVYQISLKQPEKSLTVTSIYITKGDLAIVAIIESFVREDKKEPGKGKNFRFLESTQYVDFIKLDDGFWYVNTIDDFRVALSIDGTITETRRSVKVSSVNKGKLIVDRQKIDSNTDLYSYPIRYDEEFWKRYNAPLKTEEEKQVKAQMTN